MVRLIIKMCGKIIQKKSGGKLMVGFMSFISFLMFIGTIVAVLLVVFFLYKINKNTKIQVEQNNKILQLLEKQNKE